ncbi:hypothetical protein T11_10129 [Trichinella zimbabwensis]|uniref:Uncharacterized protein n=1 Tax=Trichinella zimbabwensis TaxID=268475 RepID=A0A0V1GN51_9BILA|nr:hypothetical protein T11_10129 [Trichinella zimbabwensis]
MPLKRYFTDNHLLYEKIDNSKAGAHHVNKANAGAAMANAAMPR